MAPLLSLSLQLLTVATLILRYNYIHESIETPDNELKNEYDFIVVGTGSSGAIVAGRLAEDRKTTVLVLEAGPPADVTIDIPSAAATGTLFRSQFDWNYTYVPQRVGKAYLNEQIPSPRGHMIGGTCNYNTMLFNRGNRKNYDQWADEFGAKGWSYDDVLPFFMKSEKNMDPEIVANGFHGTDGPIEVTSWKNPPPIVRLDSLAINELGIPTTDINGPVQFGTMIMQANIDSKGRRSSSSNAYIDPNPNPHNMHILPRSLVTKVLFKGNTAIGVQFLRHGTLYKVFANKEVILSAGAIGSPHILLLSGVGPKEHLEDFKIPVVADLPTGQNYQDHPGISFNALIKFKYYHLIRETGQMVVNQLYDWFVNKAGPLTTQYFTITYMNTQSNKDKSWPDGAIETHLQLFPNNLTDYRAFQFQDRHAFDQFNSQFLGRYYIFVHPVLELPRSRGSIRLLSKDPLHYPFLDAGFYTNDQDFEDMIDVIKFALFVYEKSSIAEFVEPIAPVPGCKPCKDTPYLHECESYMRCFLVQMGYADYHPVGACRMGDPRRKDVVVDPRLRVKNVNGLRVCDTSIMPILINANTNAPAFMIGEKCAHMIKEEHHLL